MTNTKEYNEAVEKLGRAMFYKTSYAPKKFEDLEPLDQDKYRLLAQTAIDTLGVEIVSRESEPENSFKKHFSLDVFGQDQYLIREENNGNIVAKVNPLFLDLVFNKLNSKPVVYLENIKESVGK